jgi:peptidoglycan hydrolase-like protein with peptidoglycan-binding domain
MSAPLLGILTAVAACLAGLTATQAHAQTWQLHAAIEGVERPFLCKDRDTVGLIVAIEGRAMQARDSDGGKSRRLAALASELQSELCTRPSADDIVILRCKLDQQEFPGSSLSTVKISALLRADTSKGEQPFFAWTLAPIREADDYDARNASTRWCSGDEGDDAPLEPVADTVLQLQQRLYDFGLHIPRINGQMTPETVQALMDFQKWAGLPVTGQLTKRALQKIGDTPAPSPWLAVAFDGYGNYGSVRGATRREAETDAITRLRQRSNADFKVSAVASPRCIAFATTRYQERTGRRRVTTYTQAFTGSGDTPAAASETVLNYCNRQKTGGSCYVNESWCADNDQGEEKRYDTHNLPLNQAVPRFDREVPPINAPSPRYDPRNIPANAPAPNLR